MWCKGYSVQAVWLPTCFLNIYFFPFFPQISCFACLFLIFLLIFIFVVFTLWYARGTLSILWFSSPFSDLCITVNRISPQVFFLAAYMKSWTITAKISFSFVTISAVNWKLQCAFSDPLLGWSTNQQIKTNKTCNRKQSLWMDSKI